MSEEFSRDFWSHLKTLKDYDEQLYSIPLTEKKERREVITRIEDFIVDILHQLSEGRSPSYKTKTRTRWTNVYYEANVGLCVVDDPDYTTVSISHKSSVKKFGLMMKVMSMIYKLLQNNKIATKRDLFYEEPHLFHSQRALDSLVDEIACMLRISRRWLNVVATSKACIVGDLKFQVGNEEIVDCSLTPSGVLVPVDIESITSISSQRAKFMLIVEKDATFQHLIQHNFVSKLPCILITGKGVPDVNVRLMIRKLREALLIPVFALMDADPYGIEIFFVYKFSSKTHAWDSVNLALPFVHWIGILPSDIKRLQLPKDVLIPLNKKDENKLEEMLKRPYLCQSYHPQMNVEIHEMLSNGYKAEIQALNRISDSYLSQVFLPSKIKHGKWI